LKLGQYRKDFLKKDGQLIELNLMNLKTCYDVLCSNFYASWACRIDDARDYAFSYLCGFLIRAQ
jgi:hypothetical protein